MMRLALRTTAKWRTPGFNFAVTRKPIACPFSAAECRYASSQTKVIYNCTSCGKELPKWVGQCPQCKEWNTLKEINANIVSNKEMAKVERERAKWVDDEGAQISKLSEQAASGNNQKIPFSDPELSRVFGGGLVLGSVVLLAGTPGVGKSTLALQMAETISQGLSNDKRVLYVSGEESASQVGIRAKRLTCMGKSAFSKVDIVNQPSLTKVLDSLNRDSQHRALIIDSVQTVFLEDVESDAGGTVQIRACALACVHLAKSSNIPVILIGHVTKSGDVAGPKVLEHLVDVVLYFDGESSGSEIRWLHCHKNRFGANELGIFQLTDSGLIPMSDSTHNFVSHAKDVPVGVSWSVTNQGNQGSRFVVAEVQALTNPLFGSDSTTGPQRPRRMKASGVSVERIEWVSAVLAKHIAGGGIISASDIFINIIGGLHTSDRGNDFAFAMALASSALERKVIWPIKEKRAGIAFVGEVGLTGDIRPTHAMWSRINAASKAGLVQIVVPRRWWHEHQKERHPVAQDVEVLSVDSIKEAVDTFLEPPAPVVSHPKRIRSKAEVLTGRI